MQRACEARLTRVWAFLGLTTWKGRATEIQGCFNEKTAWRCISIWSVDRRKLLGRTVWCLFSDQLKPYSVTIYSCHMLRMMPENRDLSLRLTKSMGRQAKRSRHASSKTKANMTRRTGMKFSQSGVEVRRARMHPPSNEPSSKSSFASQKVPQQDDSRM